MTGGPCIQSFVTVTRPYVLTLLLVVSRRKESSPVVGLVFRANAPLLVLVRGPLGPYCCIFFYWKSKYFGTSTIAPASGVAVAGSQLITLQNSRRMKSR